MHIGQLYEFKYLLLSNYDGYLHENLHNPPIRTDLLRIICI